MINTTLLKRIFTALILIPLVIWCIFVLSNLEFALASGVVFMIAIWEWTRLMNLRTAVGRVVYLCLFIGIAALTYNSFRIESRFSDTIIILFFITFVWWLFAIYWIVDYARHLTSFGKNRVFSSMAGLFIILPCWLAINLLRQMPHGDVLTLFLLILIWSVDTSAYLIGKRWGKEKLIPTVSPGKTRVGLYGALLVTIIIAVVGGYLLSFHPEQILPLIILCLITTLFSVVGDLSISVMKRQQQIKDSGFILPGHGGILDRIDSLNAAAPIFALGILLIGAS